MTLYLNETILGPYKIVHTFKFYYTSNMGYNIKMLKLIFLLNKLK